MKIRTFLDQPFSFFNTNKRKWLYILSSTIFALVFLVLFQPYGLSEEIANPVNSKSSILLFFLSISVTTFIGLSFSQFFGRKWLGYEYVSIRKYIGWFFIEALGMTFLSFLFSFVIPDLGNDFEKELNIIFQIKVYFKAFFILLFPFFGCILYIIIKDLNYEINELEEQLNRFKNSYNEHQKDELVIFKDENNNVDFSVDLRNFLFVESSNQYILAYYVLDGMVKKHIIRNRMKTFLSQVEKLPIIQCHRSYSVNLLNVKHKVRREGKQFLSINVSEPLLVPISKSYTEVINKALSK
ncbi:LytTR family DNA-binding domain-containing protein [Seonamhaeicola marinus]|uniref:LytTR family transcriptional regulator n=1 Tax=Seonamhaeicola marinus TaxID=1912246 RepID=A0A5D0HSE0_9FLAO|nr:LytTR family DNA-binding domain-containing protein [Seonamhaeicola marinus]TYA74165.1 LytTR family transcriptional regulator [Seonamhaeicola marinus]